MNKNNILNKIKKINNSSPEFINLFDELVFELNKENNDFEKSIIEVKEILLDFKNDIDFIDLFLQLGINKKYDAEYKYSLIYFKKSLQEIDPENEKTQKLINIYNELADLYKSQYEFENSLQWYQKVIALIEGKNDTQNLQMKEIYHNIAGVYHAKGDYPQALAFYEKALAIAEKVLGKEHPSTAATYNNIASVYDDMGDYPQALAFYEKALVISEKVLGKEHPDTATTYNNMARVYDDMGDYAQALVFYKKAFLVFLKKLGTEHDYTKYTFTGMADSYLSLGHTEQVFNQYISDLLSNPLPPPTQED